MIKYKIQSIILEAESIISECNTMLDDEKFEDLDLGWIRTHASNIEHYIREINRLQKEKNNA